MQGYHTFRLYPTWRSNFIFVEFNIFEFTLDFLSPINGNELSGSVENLSRAINCFSVTIRADSDRGNTNVTGGQILPDVHSALGDTRKEMSVEGE